MALTNKALGKMLESYGFEYDENGDFFWSWRSEPKIYTDDDGDHNLFLVVDLCDDGQLIRLLTPNLYDLSKCQNKAAVMEAALATAYRTKALTYEFKAETGELRATMEYPLGSGTFTDAQLLRCLRLMIDIVDAADPVLRNAMQAGTIDWSLFGQEPPQNSDEEVAELLKQVGGVEGLRKLADKKKS